MNPKRSIKQQVSAASLSSVKQQRRGTNMPRNKSINENISSYYPAKIRDSSGSYDVTRRISWLEKVRRRSDVLGSKGKIILETRFPPDLRGIYSTRFAPDGDRFITGYGAGAIQVWHAETEQHSINVKGALDHGFPIMCLRFLRNNYSNKFFAAGAGGTLFLCGMGAGEYCDFAREEPNEINAVDVSLDGETVVTAGKDAIIRLYDINTQKLKGKMCKNEDLRSEDEIQKYHRMRIFATKFHPTRNEIFLSGGWDDYVKVWDTRIKDGRIRDIKGPHICGDSLDVLSPDNIVLTGSWTVENSLQLWDLNSGKLIENINPVNRPNTIDGEFLYCCQFYNGDITGKTIVAGGSGLGCVEVIDLSEKRIVGTFKVRKSVQAIDTNDKYLVFGGMETMFKVVSL